MDQSDSDLVAKLFYLLTVTLEEGAAAATEGQGAIESARQMVLSRRLHDHGRATIILSEVIAWLIEKGRE